MEAEVRGSPQKAQALHQHVQVVDEVLSRRLPDDGSGSLGDRTWGPGEFQWQGGRSGATLTGCFQQLDRPVCGGVLVVVDVDVAAREVLEDQPDRLLETTVPNEAHQQREWGVLPCKSILTT